MESLRPALKEARHMVVRVGWLPLGQLLSLVLSTSAFAILARTLGPRPFATYATALFVFTLVSLLLDLSPQSYVLVSGDSVKVRRAAWFTVYLSSVLGVLLSAILIPATVFWVTGSRFGGLETSVMTAALVLQFFGLVPRARLLIARAYRACALIDISSTAVSALCGVAVSLFVSSPLALAAQLGALAAMRTGAQVLTAHRLLSSEDGGHGLPPTRAAAIAYGLRVMPINVASYLTRALDSGLLPGLLPSAAAAAYARSYQLAVVPLTQVQLSIGPAVIERLARAKRSGERQGVVLNAPWQALITLSIIAGLSISSLSGVLADLLFGPAWPQANVLMAGMATVLPGMSITMLMAWLLQLHASAVRSLRHMVILLITPACVLLSATAFGPQGAVGALVASGAIVPGLVLIANRALLGSARACARLYLHTVSGWVLIVLIFFLTADAHGFWTFQDWGPGR